MSLQMVHRNSGLAPGIRQAPGKPRAGQQRADQAGPGGVGHGIDGRAVGTGCTQCLSHQGQQTLHVVPGREFRYHASILLVHCNLAVKLVRQQAAGLVVDRHGRLIAGSFDADDSHKTFKIWFLLNIRGVAWYHAGLPFCGARA